MDLKDRKRSVDLKSMKPSEADVLSEQIGARVRQDVDECVEKVNKLLEIYGLKAKMQIVIEEKDPQPAPPKAKRARSKKTSNL